MSGRRPLRIGLVGCGRIAERAYAPAIAASRQLELVSACDPSAARRSRIAPLAGSAGPAATFAGIEALLAGPAIDAVVVASPVETHLEAAAAASARGLPCLVEKPPAADAREAELLASLEPMPAIAFNRRSMLGRGLRERIPASGELALQARIDYRRASWDAVSARDEALLDLGVHLVDLALWVTGATPLAARCAAVEPDRAALTLATTRGSCELRCSTAALHRERIVVRRDGGRVASRRLGGIVAAVGGRLGRQSNDLAASIAEGLDLFAAAVAGQASDRLATAAEGAIVMRTIEACRESARRDGAAVAVAARGFTDGREEATA
ncbi:MAG TPA: Gfo/Idh/MocA family oxidoreductase [Solirubrobacterales bacterium]|nr:Gfo/Idh/MocA family oxidoreductase [Solirubrobacterales bacterium]